MQQATRVLAGDLRHLQYPSNCEPSATHRRSSLSPLDVISSLKCANMTAYLHLCDESRVSSGSFGTVYRHRYLKHGYVAVKILHHKHGHNGTNTSLFGDLRREVTSWATITHPNILPFLGLCVYHNQIGIVSPWADHGSLLSYVKREPKANRLPLLAEVASAVNHLHSLSIIHCDLKADNVLVNGDGHTWLADFGLSKVLDSDVDSAASASSNSGKGCWFIAPELHEENAHRSRATDVFAFGFLIAEVCCEKRPMPHIKSYGQAIVAILRGSRPTRAEFTCQQHGDLLWRVAAGCWDGDPQPRSSMQEIEDVLRRG